MSICTCIYIVVLYFAAVIETNKLEAQLLHLSDRYTKSHPMDARWAGEEEKKRTERDKEGDKQQTNRRDRKRSEGDRQTKPASFLDMTKSKSAAVFVPSSSEKKTRKEEREMAEEAARLLLQIAERTLMGYKTLKLWIQCCNDNKDAKGTAKREWGGDPAVSSSLDIGLAQKAMKSLKKGTQAHIVTRNRA